MTVSTKRPVGTTVVHFAYNYKISALIATKCILFYVCMISDSNLEILVINLPPLFNVFDTSWKEYINSICLSVYIAVSDLTYLNIRWTTFNFLHVNKVHYIMFAIKDEVCSSYSLFTETHKIIRYIMIYGNISFVVHFNLSAFLNVSFNCRKK